MTWEIKKEVCIVGTGFCGYAAYKKLKEKNIKLIVVEGGEVKTPSNANKQPNYKASTNKFISTNQKRIKNKIEISFRDRQFTLGGSSERWAGYIKPFEKSSFTNVFEGFEQQVWDGVRLDKYNEEILNLLNSPNLYFSPEIIAKKTNSELPILPPGLEYTVYSWATTPLRLKKYWINRLKIEKKDQKDVITGYRLTDFKFNKEKLIGLKFTNRDGQDLIVEAKYFVFCMGGIENARFTKKLFIRKKKEIPQNSNLCNFQEHPHLYYVAGFNRGEKLLPKIIRDRYNVSKQIHNSFNDGQLNISFKAWDGIGTPKATLMIQENQNKFKNRIKNIIKPFLNKIRIPNYDYLIVMRCEQSPNKKSNLRFEENKTSLNWYIESKDFSYYSDYLRRLASFLIVNNYAKDFTLQVNSTNGEAIPSSIDGGAHHMGTVPYTINNILINDKFRLTENDNTYVVGSSAFPTSGFENPTLAAMATALIAADDIILRK